MWAIAGVLVVLALLLWGQKGILQRLHINQQRVANALDEQAKLLQQQKLSLDRIAGRIEPKPHSYIPPTVRFCDLCRKEYPESNRWLTICGEGGLFPLKLCAYPRQKERPEDKWLHGDECVITELRQYMANLQRQLQRTAHTQKREYTEDNYLGLEIDVSRVLVVSSCLHCRKEYSESDFWWTVSRRGMDIEIYEGFFRHNANDYYFCSQECVVAVVQVFVGVQLGALRQEAWEVYERARGESVRQNNL